jgi:hypothetical protein
MLPTVSPVSVIKPEHPIDNQTAIHLKKRLAEGFREQLMVGILTNQDEIGLRRLAAQIRAKKVVVNCFFGTHSTQSCTCCFAPTP